METREELNAELKRLGMAKGTYACLLGQSPSVVSRHGHTRDIPGYGLSVVRAWEIMTPEQREAWVNGEVKAQSSNDGLMESMSAPTLPEEPHW